MDRRKYEYVIANGFANNSMSDVLPLCAGSIKYNSDGRKTVTGKDELAAFFESRKNALMRDRVECFGFPATVTKSSVDGINTGDRIIALAQFDKYNCTGYLTYKTNLLGKISEIHFHTNPNIQFKCDNPEKHLIYKVPLDAHDAIGYRVFPLGIMDEHVILSKHIQQYDVFQEILPVVYEHIMKYLVKDFNQGITNIAGYLYAFAMSEAVNRVKPGEIEFDFSVTNAVEGILPYVPSRYQEWINQGYFTGKKLFLGFIEYVNLRHPKDDVFTDQLMQSFLDMCLYGSTQANKDMDIGRI